MCTRISRSRNEELVMQHGQDKLKTCSFALVLASALAGPAMAQGGNLRIAFPASQEPASIDGQVDPYQSTWLFNSFISDPLVVLDSSGQCVPALATSWETSADGKIWTFKLRDGVTFQDGSKFDAEAVKFNLERIADPKTASAQLKNDIGPFTKVEVLDPLTVRITYDTPWVTLLDAIRRTPLWSPTAAQKFSVAEFQRNLVGTGPFRLSEWKQNDRLVFSRWDGYGGWSPIQVKKGPVALDTLTIRFIGEASVLGNIVKTGDADIGFALPPRVIEDYKDDKAYTFLSKDQSGTGLSMVMNTRKAPLGDIRVRQAILYTADQDAANEILYDGFYAKSEGPLNNNHPCFWDGASQMYKTDLKKASELLDAAGWKLPSGKTIREASGVSGVADGTPLRLRYTVLHHKEIGEVLQQQMRKAGIDLVVEVVPGPVQLERVRNRDFEIMYERQRSPDPAILDQIWNSKWDVPGGWAWTGFKDAKLDETVGKLRSVGDFAARCEAAKEAQKIIMDNALMLPTLSDPVFVAYRTDKVKGFQMGSEGNWFFVNNTTVEK
jgi:peptide/nickel transport system substrate-binding protein